jgi:DNA-binding response OmpR family regulator
MNSATTVEASHVGQDLSEDLFTSPAPQVWLVVDDPPTRTRLTERLREDGLRVAELDDTGALLSCLKDPFFLRSEGESSNLVIVDEGGPHALGGLELLRAMRTSHCDWPIIVLSEDCDAQTQAEAAELGPSYVYKKGSSPLSLHLAVLSILAP